VCCAIGEVCVDGVCSPPPTVTPTVPPTTQVATTAAVQQTQYCLDDDICIYYYIEYTDGCQDTTILNGPYTKLDITLINTDRWLDRCKSQYKDKCSDNCSVKIVQKTGYCCQNTCSEKPCKEDKISSSPYKWCLYDKYCSDNIASPKQMLMIEQDQECPPHPFKQDVIIEHNEQKSLNWLNTENEC